MLSDIHPKPSQLHHVLVESRSQGSPRWLSSVHASNHWPVKLCPVTGAALRQGATSLPLRCASLNSDLPSANVTTRDRLRLFLLQECVTNGSYTKCLIIMMRQRQGRQAREGRYRNSQGHGKACVVLKPAEGAESPQERPRDRETVRKGPQRRNNYSLKIKETKGSLFISC